jgi:hypothetical protein
VGVSKIARLFNGIGGFFKSDVRLFKKNEVILKHLMRNIGFFK